VAGRSWVPFTIFHSLIPPGRIMSLGSTQPVTRNEHEGYLVMRLWRQVRRANNLATFMCCLEIPGALTYWSPKGPVKISRRIAITCLHVCVCARVCIYIYIYIYI